MSYQNHLLRLLEAFRAARPDIKNTPLSLAAGLGKNWVSDFEATGAGTFSRAEQLVEKIAELTPEDSRGDHVRALLKVFRDDLGRDAA